MNFLSRAFASMTRNPLKALLLLLITFVLGIVISAAISVQQAILNTDTNIRATMPPVAMVGIDWNELHRQHNRTGEWIEVEEESPSLETMHAIGALSYVRAYEFSTWGMMASRDIERYIGNEKMSWSRPLGDWETVTFKGVQRPDFLDLAEGRVELISGRTFTDEEVNHLSYVALVSENFARLNNLHIGSVLTLEDIIWDFPEHGFDCSFYVEENIHIYRTHDFEIIGTFSPLVEFDTGCEYMNHEFADNFENTLYVPNTVIRASSAFYVEQRRELNPDEEHRQEIDLDEEVMWYQNVYILYSSSDMPAFRAAVEDMTPHMYTAVDAVGGEFTAIEASMDSLTHLADIILWVAIAAAVIILSLLITLFLRERRREIGIYLALGEKRVKVVAQMLAEVMLVALIAVALSLLAGNLLADNISEAMLEDALIAEQNLDERGVFTNFDQRGFGVSAPSTDEVLAAYNVSLDLTTTGLFFTFAIVTVFMATIIPMLYIVRFNPKKIML